MRISDLVGRGRPVFSFEFFPPKDEAAVGPLMSSIADLRDVVQPDYVSVTYGAGGSTRARTVEVVTRIQRELKLNVMAHLACLGHGESEICEIVGRLIGNGIENILALRGDPPQTPPISAADATPAANAGSFQHATELIQYLEDNYQVDVGAACYPEGHPESTSAEDDLKWTKAKQDAGAAFLITQLFFDDRDYFAFVDRARKARVLVPILPGIMPITNVAQVERFTKMCGAKIPPELSERLHRYQDDPASVMATGIEHAIKQCRALLDAGAPGLHFYTLNKSHSTRTILSAVRKM